MSPPACVRPIPDWRWCWCRWRTRGDEQLDRSLAAIGGKGLFLKELELAMQRGEADCAVHSLKDVPMELEPGFGLPAVLERAIPADAFVSNDFDGIDALPPGAVVGTSSLRRQAQLRARRPDLQLRDLRGNVNTRLAKLDAGEYDAIVLGLCRPAAAGPGGAYPRPPGAAGLVAGAGPGGGGGGDPTGRCAHRGTGRRARARPTRTVIEAERALNLALHGSCHVPVAAFAELVGQHLQLRLGRFGAGVVVAWPPRPKARRPTPRSWAGRSPPTCWRRGLPATWGEGSGGCRPSPVLCLPG